MGLPSTPAALVWLHQGNSLFMQERYYEAVASYDRAIALEPGLVAALYNRGNALLELGLHEEALQSFDRSLALDTNNADAFNNRGLTLLELGRREAALTSFAEVLTLNPLNVDAWVSHGYTLQLLERSAEAIVSCDRALALRPDSGDALYNRGNALVSLGRHEEAVDCYARALAIKPDDPEVRFNLGLSLLALGDYARGWPAFELRMHMGGRRRAFPGPQWHGEDIAGKAILLHTEQGLGDTLQFCRYVPLVAARGATVILEVPGPLERLLSRLPGVSYLVVRGDAIPAFDWHCSLLSLPLAFGTRLETIPGRAPYLSAEPRQVAVWRERLKELAGLHVGLVWAGEPRHHDSKAQAVDRRRSVTLQHFAGLAGVTGISLVSLQKGDAAAEARSLPPGLAVHDWSDELGDFADTAALLAALDLVISVDTAVVHLAGGLGKPVWVLSRFDACWRWLCNRPDSPWYPSARVFGQPARGDWGSVMDEVARALRQRISVSPATRQA